MKILFQVLCTGNMRAELQQITMLCAKLGADTSIVFGHRGYMASSRNTAIHTFLKTDCDVLVQCDEDVIPPLNILDITKHRKPLVGTIALCAGDKGPRPNFMPLTGTQAECIPIPPGQIPLMEVDWIGTGCYSVTREAAELMISKYGAMFAHDNNDDGSLKTGVDVFMCRRAREAGLRIWLDRKMLCGHNKDMIWASTKDGEFAILPWGAMWIGDNVPKDGSERKSYAELLEEMGLNPGAGSWKKNDA